MNNKILYPMILTLSIIMLFSSIISSTSKKRSGLELNRNEMLKRGHQQNKRSKISDHRLMNNKFETFSKNNAKLELQKQSGMASVIDSVIITDLSGDKTKESFNYNFSAKMTTQLSQWLQGNQWRNLWMETITYDQNGNLLTEIDEYWNDTDFQWEIEWKETNTYTSNNYIETSVVETWEDEVFYSSRDLYSYSGNTTTIKEENWENNKWILNQTLIYEYNSNGDLVFGSWESDEQKGNGIIIYDSNNSIISIKTKDTILNGSLWVDSDSSSDLRTYDTNNNLLSRNDEKFEWDGSNWIKMYSSSESYSYDSNNNLLTHNDEAFEWYGSQLQPSYTFQFTYQYDSNNNKISTEAEESYWDEGQLYGQDHYRVNYNYDSNNNMTNASVKNYDGSSWLDGDSYVVIESPYFRYKEIETYGHRVNVTYSTITDITDENLIISDYQLSQNYPNPFNPSTVIEYSIPNVASDFSPSNTTLKVYDILGNEVAELVNEVQSAGNHSVSFNASSLSSGIYFVRLNAGNFSQVRKMTLLK